MKYLEIAYIRIAQQSVLLVGVEQTEVLHDDGDEQVEDDVGDDDVEGAEVRDGGHKVTAVRLPEAGMAVPRAVRRREH